MEVGHFETKFSPIIFTFGCNGDRASSYFKPFLIGNMSDKFFPTQTLLYVSDRHVLLKKNSVKILKIKENLLFDIRR
jgi:hypothetical protein